MIHGIERIFTGIFLMVVGFVSLIIGVPTVILGLMQPEKFLPSFDRLFQMSPFIGIVTVALGLLVIWFGYLWINQNDG